MSHPRESKGQNHAIRRKDPSMTSRIVLFSLLKRQSRSKLEDLLGDRKVRRRRYCDRESDRSNRPKGILRNSGRNGSGFKCRIRRRDGILGEIRKGIHGTHSRGDKICRGSQSLGIVPPLSIERRYRNLFLFPSFPLYG